MFKILLLLLLFCYHSLQSNIYLICSHSTIINNQISLFSPRFYVKNSSKWNLINTLNNAQQFIYLYFKYTFCLWVLLVNIIKLSIIKQLFPILLKLKNYLNCANKTTQSWQWLQFKPKFPLNDMVFLAR